MILSTKIDIHETKKLFQGQGHKVQGQGQICTLVKNIVLTIYDEPMIGY